MVEIVKTKDGSFESIKATSLSGNLCAIHGMGAASFSDTIMSIFAFGGDPREHLRIKSVFNIKGARDGANSLVTFAVNPSYVDENNVRKLRVKETPEELKKAFTETGLETVFPTVGETRRNKIYKAIFGSDLYPPVSE